MELLETILGPYTEQFVRLLPRGFFAAVATLLFCWEFEKRTHFIARVLVGFLFASILTVVAAVIRTGFPGISSRIVVSVFFYVSVLPIALLSYNARISDVIRNWCAAIATVQINAGLYILCLMLLGGEPGQVISLLPASSQVQWLFYYTSHLLIIFAVWCLDFRICSRNVNRARSMDITILTVISFVLLAVAEALALEFQEESRNMYALSRFMLIIICMFILMLRHLIFDKSHYRSEIDLMEQLLIEERKQYHQSKENIDIINMRCHDLKHQLEEISARLTTGEIESLKSAVEIYDSTIKTGSEVLDLILYEKELICRKKGIRLTCLADEATLSFMSRTHLYSLMSNALGNAMDAVKKIDDPEKRVISINVMNNRGFTEISIRNYFEGDILWKDGTPITTKKDKIHHGIGSKSMRYIVEFYGGRISQNARDGIFVVKFTFPPQE